MVDAHAHLDAYGEELPRALDQIRARSVRTLAVSIDIESFRATQRIAASEPLVVPSFGVHPWEAPRFAHDLSALDEPLGEAPLIGEIGLDRRFVRDEEQYPAQQDVFDYFLDDAERTGRPVNLHTSGAERQVLQSLGARTLPAVIVHWYSGPIDLVDEFLRMGAYFTVGVEVLRSERIRGLARTLPEDRLLTETDNPGGWEWMTGEVGYPRLLVRVEEAVAELRGVPREHLAHQVEQNLHTLLRSGGIDPDELEVGAS